MKIDEKNKAKRNASMAIDILKKLEIKNRKSKEQKEEEETIDKMLKMRI